MLVRGLEMGKGWIPAAHLQTPKASGGVRRLLPGSEPVPWD